ncbi:unnamed protein product [Urochloa decumbens]|uniref:Alpha/beta hydrolase fold-3 domain-containing protein n=1 Tax=Urochloa decumbens TaxID=240449 RepID=A0ABC9CX69_9POAL
MQKHGHSGSGKPLPLPHNAGRYATVAAVESDGDDELVHDFSPLLLVYRSGRLERPLIVPLVPPSLDAATGVESKDVPLSPSSSPVRLYLPPAATESPVGGEKEHRRRGRGLTKRKHLWEFVCPGAADGVDNTRMNPMAPGAPGLEGLACEKVMVCVAEGDHLRWRGKAYAEAVARARKEKCGDDDDERPVAAVEAFESEGVGHVFYLLDPEMEEAKRLLGKIAAFVSAK